MWFSFVIAVSSIFMSEQLFLRSSYTTRFSGKYYNSRFFLFTKFLLSEFKKSFFSSSLNITNLGDGSGSNVTKEAIIGIFDAVSGILILTLIVQGFWRELVCRGDIACLQLTDHQESLQKAFSLFTNGLGKVRNLWSPDTFFSGNNCHLKKCRHIFLPAQLGLR